MPGHLRRNAAPRTPADGALRRGEAHDRLLAGGGKDYAVFLLDPQGRVLGWGPGAEPLKGYRAEEIIGHHFSCFYLPEDIAQRKPERALHAALAQGHFEEEAWRLRKDGSRFWAHVLITALYGDAGHLRGYATLTRDLTERGGAEATLRSAVDHVVDGIISTDERGTVVLFNPAAERIFGYAASEVIGRNVNMLMPEPYHSEHDGYIANYLRTGHARVLGIGREVSGRRKDGCTFPLDLAVSVFRVGEARYFTGIMRDVTERKRVEEALGETRERLHALVTTAVNAIITINQRGIIESVNPAAEKMFGYTGPELIGQNVKVLMPSPHREQHDCYLANYLETGVRKVIGTGREVLARRRDGTVFPVDLAVSEIPHLKLFTGIISDITRRKELEREVLEIAALEERRLGQELHDGLGQQLTGLNLMADALAQRLQTECPALATLASRIASGLERAHQQTRSLSWGLVPVEMDGDGLRAALIDLAERTSKQLGVACTFQCAEPVPVADAVAATHLFRIAQEAVSNAVRHGAARNIRLAVREEPAALVLSIRDDGKGFPGRPDEARGLGLRLMRYRAGMIGGVLAVGPAEGGGVVVSCMVPRGTRHG